MERLPAGRLPLAQPYHVTHPGHAHHPRPGPGISGLRRRTDSLIIWSLKTFTANSSRATRQESESAHARQRTTLDADQHRHREVAGPAFLDNALPGLSIPCVRHRVGGAPPIQQADAAA